MLFQSHFFSYSLSKWYPIDTDFVNEVCELFDIEEYNIDMVSPEQDKADMLTYMDELGKSRLTRFRERAAAIPANAVGSSEWLKDVGDYWEEARTNSGLSRYEVAGKIGVHVNVIRFLELGMAYPEELYGKLLPQLSQSLTGNLESYETFNQKYKITEMPIKKSRFKLLPFVASRWEPINTVS